MELQHLDLKLPVAGAEQVPPQAFIPVFHDWVRAQDREELLIDVADYSHVPDGPGIILIGHEADYSMDDSGGHSGLRYNRKGVLSGSNRQRLGQALRALVGAAQQLEDTPALSGRLVFSRREVALAVNDRLLAPNLPETFAEAEPELMEFFRPLLGDDVLILYRQGDPRERFSVSVTAQKPFDLSAITSALS